MITASLIIAWCYACCIIPQVKDSDDGSVELELKMRFDGTLKADVDQQQVQEILDVEFNQSLKNDIVNSIFTDNNAEFTTAISFNEETLASDGEETSNAQNGMTFGALLVALLPSALNL